MKSTINFKTAGWVFHLGKCEIAIPMPLPHPAPDAPVQTIEVEVTITTTNRELREAIERMLKDRLDEGKSGDGDNHIREDG